MIHQIRTEQFLNATIEEVWDFVTFPGNLKKITPEYMNFVIKSKNMNEKIYPGMIICYKVSPVLKIPTSWVTEITHVKKNEFFVDEQRVGPYAIWHHEHLFREEKSGVKMIDIISYKLPFGIIGRCMHYLFIKNRLNDIFNYRYKKMNEIFNTSKCG
tara:strand:- start:425 stop:895 length:471 start_codon:yes stop_codon:yes gene_type:complete